MLFQMLLAVFVCVLGRIGQAGHGSSFMASGSRSLMAILLVFVDSQKPETSGKDGAGDEEEDDDKEEPEGAAGGVEGGDPVEKVENEEEVITGGQDKEEDDEEEEEVEDAEEEADEYLRSFMYKKGEVSFQFQAGQGGPSGSQLLSNFVCLL